MIKILRDKFRNKKFDIRWSTTKDCKYAKKIAKKSLNHPQLWARSNSEISESIERNEALLVFYK